jgi:hypothetical protein
MYNPLQESLFPKDALKPQVSARASSTFINNMSLPVHRWFRYSAGFSAEWVATVIREARLLGPVRVFDPFAGSATTLIAAETLGVESWGIDAHPFVSRVAQAKLAWRSDPVLYREQVERVLDTSQSMAANIDDYPPLLHTCYDPKSLASLDILRRSYELLRDDTSASELVWLTIVGILRKVARVGTAPWQYLLPKRIKSNPQQVAVAFKDFASMVYHDMQSGQSLSGPRARFFQTDARICEGVPPRAANLVVTSPPYPNNYDYADATRLEMTFMGEVRGWGDLQDKVRKYLVRSCSQHVPEKSIDLEAVLASPELDPIRSEISTVCHQLAEIRESKGGRKTYHLMIACYFRDMAQVWTALRTVCDSPSTVCFVIGDSAPYGVYVPTVPWLGKLATAAGFNSFTFEKTRDRNIKWKNRKHRVPLQEGRLWVKG